MSSLKGEHDMILHKILSFSRLREQLPKKTGAEFWELFSKYFPEFPKDRLFCFFIDKEYHPLGDAQIFDTGVTALNTLNMLIHTGNYISPTDGGEANYFDSLKRAFYSMLTTIDKNNCNLTTQLYELFHDLAVNKVRPSGEAEDHKKGFGINVGYPPKNDLGAAAKKELEESDLVKFGSDFEEAYLAYYLTSEDEATQYLESLRKYETNKNAGEDPFDEKSFGIFKKQLIEQVRQKPIILSRFSKPLYKNEELNAAHKESIKTYLTDLFNEFSKNRKNIGAIVGLCRALLIVHVFPDGNQRTIVNILLPKLLIEAGLPPSIVENPFDFDGYKTIKELISEIEKGSEYFRSSMDPEITLVDRECRQSFGENAFKKMRYIKKTNGLLYEKKLYSYCSKHPDKVARFVKEIFKHNNLLGERIRFGRTDVPLRFILDDILKVISVVGFEYIKESVELILNREDYDNIHFFDVGFFSNISGKCFKGIAKLIFQTKNFKMIDLFLDCYDPRKRCLKPVIAVIEELHTSDQEYAKKISRRLLGYEEPDFATFFTENKAELRKSYPTFSNYIIGLFPTT